jgi:lipoteichoic acid synthase
MGQLDSTLIITLGDHGEAFGRHGQYVHASNIYEENVHIPLVFINRRLFAGEESSVIAGQVDIAPTVLDLLGLPQPSDWQGRSLFASDRSPRTYFFAPWADLLFGYREGERKNIFNATSGQYEAYDLKDDPQETRNLIDQLPGARQQILDRTAAWVQYQNRMIKNLTTSAVASD